MQRGLTCLLERHPVDRMLCPGSGTNGVSRGPSLFAVWCIHCLIDFIDSMQLLDVVPELHFVQEKISVQESC